MINIKKNVKTDTEYHEEILKKIYDISGNGIKISLITVGKELISVSIDDKNLTSGKKTTLKNYVKSL